MLTLKQTAILRRMSKKGIPASIVKYTKNIFDSKIQGKYSNALMEFPKKVIKSINLLIQKASDATGQSKEDLIDSSDFNPKDLPSERIEALFAELRIINHLSLERFTDICLINSKRKQKRADISARKDGNNYIIEVTCSSSCAAENKYRITEITNFIVRKMKGDQNKELQLINTMNRYKANKMVLAVILDTEDKKALNTTKDILEIARQVYLKIGEKNLHIFITLGGPDIVYEFHPGKLFLRFMPKTGYIKARPLIIKILNMLIKKNSKPVRKGEGNAVYPPWTLNDG